MEYYLHIKSKKHGDNAKFWIYGPHDKFNIRSRNLHLLVGIMHRTGQLNSKGLIIMLFTASLLFEIGTVE
jgi:hypothetical protein